VLQFQRRCTADLLPALKENDMNAKTPIKALYQNADECGQRVALIVGAEHWSYRRLAAGVDRLARAMWARGVRAGDRVALHMPNCTEFVLAYFACFRIGAIASPLNIRSKASEIGAMLERLKPALYIGEAGLYARIASLGSDVLPFGARYVVGPVVVEAGALPWEALFRSNNRTPLPDLPDDDAAAVLLATSGTTGLPKFVTHTQATLAATIDACVRLGFENHPDPILMVSAPLVHVSGFVILMLGIRFTAPVVMVERFEPDVVLDAIELHRCSWMLGLPFMFMELLRSQRGRSRNVDSLRFCVCAGDVCPLDLQYEFPRLFGIELHSVWGASEVIGSMIHGLQPGAVCRAVPGFGIRLVDDCGEPVACGEVGELHVRGPSVTVGYWSWPGVIEPATSDGWFSTGDLMRQGQGDEFWFVGRMKDLIIRGGSNISPLEIERALLSHPAVRDAAVVGIPDTALGERVAAAVNLGNVSGKTVVVADILAGIRSQLADYKVPEWLQVVDEIPRNANGRIDRGTLRALMMRTAVVGR
jgi:long-chain acyl-CoA synthetase